MEACVVGAQLTAMQASVGDPARSVAEAQEELSDELGWLQEQASLLQDESELLDADLQPQMRAAISQAGYDRAAFAGQQDCLHGSDMLITGLPAVCWPEQTRAAVLQCGF